MTFLLCKLKPKKLLERFFGFMGVVFGLFVCLFVWRDEGQEEEAYGDVRDGKR